MNKLTELLTELMAFIVLSIATLVMGQPENE
jgi:hypothetical protein